MRDASPRALRKFGLTVGGVFLLPGAAGYAEVSSHGL
jgi:hypothetical protein